MTAPDAPRHIPTTEWDDAIAAIGGQPIDWDSPHGAPSEDWSQVVEDRLLRLVGDEEHLIRAAERRAS